MKIEILEQKKNPLLKREELSVSLEHPGKATPSRKEILPELAKALKSREDLIIIDKIFSVTGKNICKARVLAYAKRDEIPPEKIEKMKSRMVEKKKVPVPAEGKPEAAPKEGEKPAESKAKEGKAEEKPAEEPRPEEKKPPRRKESRS